MGEHLNVSYVETNRRQVFIFALQPPYPGCFGLRSGLHAVTNRKIRCFDWESNRGCPTHSVLLYRLIYPALFKMWISHENLRINVWDSCILLRGFSQPPFCTLCTLNIVIRFFFGGGGVLLTVHLSIFILVINQLEAQNLFYNKFISCLYMFNNTILTSWRWAHGARNM